MRIRIGRYRISVPKSRSGRIGTGVVLVVLGFVPGPPGPAAIPVGLTILTLDYPRGRRWRRVVIVRVGRRWQTMKAKRELRRAERARGGMTDKPPEREV